MITSSFPVAIGTGLMLESLFESRTERYDPLREIPVNLNVNNYKHHIYSIHTIVRNMLSAIPHKNKIEVINDKMLPKLIEAEVESIFSLYDGTKCQPILFIGDYSKPIDYMNINKASKSNAQVVLYEMVHDIVKRLEFTNVDKFDKKDLPKPYKLPTIGDKHLLTTSFAVDLHTNSNTMTLLESHTGKVKDKYEFNSKYRKTALGDITTLPFNEKLHIIAGDRTLINPIKMSWRKELFQIALENAWTPRTTEEKIMKNLSTYSNDLHQLVLYYKKLY